MDIKFPGPRLPSPGLPDPQDIAALEAMRDQEAFYEAAADGEPQRRAERNKLKAATHSAVQADLKA